MHLTADFEADWNAAMRRIMVECWAMDLSAVQHDELPIMFFHAVARRIEPRPRTVELSTTFSCPPGFRAGWDSLRAKIEAGNDLSPHLSLGIEKVTGTDLMLFDWGIHHLHLGQSQHPRNDGFIERTGPVVFGFPTNEVFHAIGIYEHGAWSDRSVIETLHANWPSLTVPMKLQREGISLTQDYSDQDRQMLRKAGINLITPLSDGTYLFPLGGGYSGNGISAHAVTDADKERRRIQNTQVQVLAAAEQIEAALCSEGYDGNAEVFARLNFGSRGLWVSFEGFTTVAFSVFDTASANAPEHADIVGRRYHGDSKNLSLDEKKDLKWAKQQLFDKKRD